MKREFRIFKHAELRAKKGDKPGLEGHAAVFNQLSEDLGYYREKIMPGAFSDHLKTDPDIRALFNHDPSIVLGRTKSGTLRVNEDKLGLAFDCDMPDTQSARDLMTSIDRGDVDQCSFGFRVVKQKWSEEPDPTDTSGQRTMIVREVHAAQVFDVSPVTYPAYPQTDVNARAAELRSMFPDGVPKEILEHVPGIAAAAERRAGAENCACNCAACDDGECDECTNKECDDPNCEDCPMQDGERALPSTQTKRVDGEDLRSSAFAFVGDPANPSTWKFPIRFSTAEKTKRHIRNALTRFDQAKGVPAEEKSKVSKRIAAAAKKHEVKVPEENAERSLTEAEREYIDLQYRSRLARV
ncbi:MAG TPA: HK97 family phage prohead protease [Candidatus Acidoferrales bacterium]